MRLLIVITIMLFSFTNTVQAQSLTKGVSNLRKGIASFYHNKFEGRKTATGEVFYNDKYTAACNSMKLGTYAKVTNVSNGKVVYVRINDRMGHQGRAIDLTSLAATKLDFVKKGLANVKIEAVSAEEGKLGILAQRNAELSEQKNTL